MIGYKIFLSFSSSWLNEKNFGGICLVWSLLMNPSFIWEMYASLSSNSTVGSLLTGNLQVAWMCWVTDLNHTHSRLASWISITSAWLKEVAISVCSCERQEIAVPPHVKHILFETYFYVDLTSNLHLHNKSFLILILWNKKKLKLVIPRR